MAKESVKICLLGVAGVGKTSIINRFSTNTFDSELPSTSGGSYSVKHMNIDGKEIALNIWDTAGQEKFRSLTKHFYRDAYIICLVYDITKVSTFETLKGWYDDVKQNAEKYTILCVVGNKTDCFEQEEVKEEDARQYAESIKAEFHLVSAKTGDNIPQLFEKLVRLYLGPDFVKKVIEMKSEKGEVAKITKEKVVSKQKDKKGCC